MAEETKHTPTAIDEMPAGEELDHLSWMALGGKQEQTVLWWKPSRDLKQAFEFAGDVRKKLAPGGEYSPFQIAYYNSWRADFGEFCTYWSIAYADTPELAITRAGVLALKAAAAPPRPVQEKTP